MIPSVLLIGPWRGSLPIPPLVSPLMRVSSGWPLIVSLLIYRPVVRVWWPPLVFPIVPPLIWRPLIKVWRSLFLVSPMVSRMISPPIPCRRPLMIPDIPHNTLTKYDPRIHTHPNQRRGDSNPPGPSRHCLPPEVRRPVFQYPVQDVHHKVLAVRGPRVVDPSFPDDPLGYRFKWTGSLTSFGHPPPPLSLYLYIS